MTLAIVMIMGMLPSNIFTVIADAVGTTYSGTTIDVLDGKTTAAELYAAFKATMGEPSAGGLGVLGQKVFQYGDTTVYNNDTELTLSDAIISVKKSTGSSWGSTKWSSATNFTIKIYHNITASVDASANADGKGGVTATGKVYHNEKATIAVTDVEGFKAELYNGNNKVAELSDANGWTYTIDKATASVAYTVKYVSEAATEYNVKVEEVNGDWGEATLGTDKGIAGAEIALTVTPLATSGNAMYTYTVAVTNGTYNASTGKVIVAGTGEVVVTVTFTKSELEVNSNPEVLINGYDKDTITADLKAKLISAVLKNPGMTTDYTVSVYLGLDLGILGKYDYVSLDDASLLNRISGWIDDLGGEFWIKVDNTINVKIADKQGRTVVTDVITKESREETTDITLDDLDYTENTLADVISAIKNNVKVNGASTNVTVTLTPDTALSTTKQTYTATVVAPATKDYLESSATFTITADISIYSITWDVDGVKTTVDYAYGETIVPPADPAKEHYTFNGWKDWVENSTASSDVTYTAQWTPVNYTISWDTDGDGDVDESKEYAYGTPAADIVVPAAPSKESTAQYHFRFDKWDNEIVAVSGDTTYTATFTEELRSYTVTFTDKDGNELASKAYTYGTPAESIELPEAPTVIGHAFNGWTVNKVTGDATYKAGYTPNKYAITWIVDGVETTENYTYGEKVVKANPDKDGWGFVGWYYAGTETRIDLETFVMGVDAIRLEARFFEAEAMIGETLYETLAEALTAAKSGDIIEILTDITLKEKLIINENVTIDGRGYSIFADENAVWYTVSGKLQIKNYSPWVVLKANNITFKNLVVNSNSCAGGIKIENAEDVVFDNVKILNTKADAVTVVGSLLIRNYFKVETTYSVIDARSGRVIAEADTVFDITNWRGNVSPATSDLKQAKDTEGNLFFCAYSNTAYYVKLTSIPDGLTLLKDAELEANVTVTGTKSINLNGQKLTIADSKTLQIGKQNSTGALIIENAGSISGNLVLGNETATITAPEILNITNGLTKYDVQYDKGKYFLGSKLTFVYGNGDPDDVLIVPAGYSIGVAVDPVWADHVFTGWDPEVNLSPDGNATYTAQWKADANNNGVPDADEKVTVTIVGNGTVNGNTEIFEVLYDSITENAISINAVPVIENGCSKSFVSSITAGGVELPLTYANYGVTLDAPVAGHNIVVTFTDCGFVYDEDGQMRFYVGMETPEYETLFNAVIVSPEYSAEFVESVKYLARPAAAYQMQVPVLYTLDLPGWINALGVKDLVLGGNMVDIDLDDAWLDVGESFKTLTPEELQKQYDTEIQKIKDKIAAIKLPDNWSLDAASDVVNQFLTIREELNTLIETISHEAKYLGYHQFGASGIVDENGNAKEILQVIYDNGAVRLVDEEVYITLVDGRIETTITGGDLTFEYDEFTDKTIMDSLVLTDVNGNVIDGDLVKYVELVGTQVGSRTYTVYYEGSWDYKPCAAEFTLTVIKAPSSTNVPNINVTYGDAYSGAPVITNKHGNAVVVDTIEFILGLDISELDIDGDGVKGLEGKMQLILTDDLQTILNMVGLENGAELNINDLISMLTNTGLLEQWGISGEMVNTLKQVLDSINGVVEANNLMVTIGGSYPADIGAYLHGAVAVDGNYETSYDVGYIVIKPDASRVYLDWNYTDSNAVFTWQLLQFVDLGASAFDNKAFTTKNDAASALINNLFFGIDENGEFAIGLYAKGTDVEVLEKALGNGAFVQLAFIAEFGNEFYYAVPIVRPVVIIPNVMDVEIKVDGNVNDFNTVDFDNTHVDVEVIIDYKDLVVEDTWTVETTVNYYGMMTNGTVYQSNIAPKHAGIYAVTATIVIKDENSELIAVGADAATVVILPVESSIEVEDKIEAVKPGVSHAPKDQVTAGSAADKNLNVDTTIISAGISSNGTFTQNGWNAINGSVNVDFPRWVDALLAQYAPSIIDGITVSDLADKLNDKLPQILAALEEQGATNEVLGSLTNAINNVVAALEKMPANTTVSFADDIRYTNVGAYVIVAVVTDSDHYPSVDTGLLVITPDVTQVELKWNYEDANGIFTRDLLDDIDLWAKAYEALTGKYSEEATGKITYQFIGINSDGDPVIYTDPTELPNGAYIEIAYIEFELDGVMYISDMIARPVVMVPSNCNVDFENVEIVFDNNQHGVNVTVTDLEGNVIDIADGTLTILYAGIQTNGQAYLSSDAPVHAGVYEVLVSFIAYDENGELRYYGAKVGYVKIDMAQSSIDVTGGNVKYDGDGHTVNVTVTGGNVKPDHTLISGGVTVSGDISQIGVDAFHGNVNVDFPKWLDANLKQYEWFDEGVDAAYLMDFIGAYRDELMAALPADVLAQLNITEAQLNAYIDQLLTVLEKLPEDVNITFEDAITYTEPGYYFYYGIVTDSDHYPATDTGLLVIEKLEMDFDLTDTTVTWDDEGHMTNTNNPNNADYVTVIIDRENNTFNLMLDADAQYLLNTMARILGEEFDGDVQLSTIINDYSGQELAAAMVELISQMQELELSEEIQKVLAAVKAELENLPASGTVLVNGELPSQVGEYEVYAISYSEYYNTTASEATLEIVPVRIVVEVENDTKHYGDADPTPSYTVKYYDHLGNALTGFATDVIVNITCVAGENVGKYTYYVTASVADEHYEITSVTEDAYLEILPAELIVTVNGQNKTYGDADPDLTYEVTFGAGSASAVELGIVISRVPGENVGDYNITASYNASNNYVVTVVDGTLTINKATLGINIDDQTKFYGNTDPELTYTATGLVNGDTTALITISREPGENVGEYKITVTVNSDNYDVVSNAGKLTITPAQITVTIHDQQITVDDVLPELTYGMVMNGKVTAQQMGLEIVTNAVEGKHGVYTITASYTQSDNYVVTANEGTMTITIGDNVCWNVQTGKYYKTAHDGLLAAKDGETVQMLVSSDEEQTGLWIDGDIMLDLNGKVLHTNNVVGFGNYHVVDNSEENTGLLKVARNRVVLNSTNKQLPIWNGVNGYVFSDFTFQQMTVAMEDGVTFYSLTIPNLSILQYLADGAEDNGISVKVRMTWTAGNGTSEQEFTYYDTDVANVLGSYDEEQGKFTQAFYADITGINNITDLKISVVVVSDTGVEISADSVTWPRNN